MMTTADVQALQHAAQPHLGGNDNQEIVVATEGCSFSQRIDLRNDSVYQLLAAFVGE